MCDMQSELRTNRVFTSVDNGNTSYYHGLKRWTYDLIPHCLPFPARVRVWGLLVPRSAASLRSVTVLL